MIKAVPGCECLISDKTNAINRELDIPQIQQQGKRVGQ